MLACSGVGLARIEKSNSRCCRAIYGADRRRISHVFTICVRNVHLS